MTRFFSEHESLFSALALLLATGMSFWYFFLSFFSLPELLQKKAAEQRAIEYLKEEQTKALSEETRSLLKQYSVGVSAVDILLSSRIFHFALFFEDLQKQLKKTSVLSNLSVDEHGDFSFLIQTPSYVDAARQMKQFASPIFGEVQISSISQASDAEKEPMYSFIVQGKVHHDYQKP